jgi:hypothetical protein
LLRFRPQHCDICAGTGDIYYDHDHRTGFFRGWLCRLCNSAIGMAKDDPSILRRMATYLETRGSLPPEASWTLARRAASVIDTVRAQVPLYDDLDDPADDGDMYTAGYDPRCRA